MKMANPDDFLYEYAVVRYVPRVDREEFINIGLLMLCKRQRWMQGRIAFDEERLMAFDPKANLATVEKFSSIFERDDVPAKDIAVEEKYRWLAAVKSAVIQTSPSHPGIIMVDNAEMSREEKLKTLECEFDRLFDCLVRM